MEWFGLTPQLGWWRSDGMASLHGLPRDGFPRVIGIVLFHSLIRG
jgi:hypothetical protein